SREIQQSNKAPRHHNDNFESDKRFIETVAELRCTCRTSRKVFGKELPNHQLHTVAARCRYDLTNHHHALADAEACAQIALLIIPEPKKVKVDLHTGNLF
ncbi:MAG: hypothetical protein E6641_23105, partial [Bacteroides faecis]|nr:hypothetical protein [Bacteroides faecis]